MCVCVCVWVVCVLWPNVVDLVNIVESHASDLVYLQQGGLQHIIDLQIKITVLMCFNKGFSSDLME